MDNDIKNAFEYITPTEEQKERMLKGIRARMTSRSGKTDRRTFRIAVVAAVLCLVFAMVACGDEIGSLFAGLFTENEIVGGTVRTDVYKDSDKHVVMTVEELLSDMSTVRMVVHYRATDKQGQKWLAGLSHLDSFEILLDGYDNYALNIDPDFKDNNTDLYGVNWGFDTTELEEYRTDTERRFVVYMEASGDDWGTPNVKLSYAMTDELKTVTLDVNTNIEKRYFTLDNSNAADKVYKPTRAVLSPLSVIIYGEVSEDAAGKVQGDEGTVDSLRLVYANGKKEDMIRDYNEIYNGLSRFHRVRGDTVNLGEYTIVSTSFFEPTDPDTIVGIEIDGVYYPFQ